ncbi:M12 family metallopeptidase [Pseudomonas poae]|uniref:M12 family metallopeptidase n=1 Tax=Pseudomonas poae TaxID=200451 RepID=UPI000519548D|nr:M12 family metallopeptidase [Pseudomonas poae]NMZ51389.1 matrixin family metalloprotease [Pseudomonas poae]
MSSPIHVSTFIPRPSDIPGETSASNPVSRTKRGIADTSKRWPDGIVNIALDLRDNRSKALVIDALREWAHHTPALRFNVVDGKDGDIRITDDEGFQGSWSAVGIDAKDMPLDEPTMHLDRNDDSAVFRTTALHEIGHALGMEHEHQHPANTINWDKDYVYRSMNESQGWDKDMIDLNIFSTYTGPNVLQTPYDTRSIMHYATYADETIDGQEVPQNYSLSKGDQTIIRTLYTPRRFKGGDADSSANP